MLGKKATCSCNKKDALICPKCNTTENAVSLIVLSRLGLNSPEKKYLAVLEKLMEIKFCQGVIGGKP